MYMPIDRGRHRRVIAATAAFVAAAWVAPAGADHHDWTGLESSTWNNADNWDPIGVPGPADTAAIEDAGDVLVTNTTAPLAFLYISGLDSRCTVHAIRPIIVDGVDLTGRMTIAGVLATVAVLPNDGAPGVDVDNLDSLDGGELRLEDGAIARIGCEVYLHDGGNVGGAGELRLSNEMGGAVRVLDIDGGSLGAGGGSLVVRALGGGADPDLQRVPGRIGRAGRRSRHRQRARGRHRRGDRVDHRARRLHRVHGRRRDGGTPALHRGPRCARRPAAGLSGREPRLGGDGRDRGDRRDRHAERGGRFVRRRLLKLLARRGGQRRWRPAGRPFRGRDWPHRRFVEDHGLFKLLGTIRYPGGLHAA